MTPNRLADAILELIMAECRYWHGRDEARRGGFASLYASAHALIQQAKSAPPSPDAELVELLRGLVEIVGRKNRGRAGSPNHSHTIPGIWDSDNGDLAGKPCAECALYDLAVARIAALQP